MPEDTSPSPEQAVETHKSLDALFEQMTKTEPPPIEEPPPAPKPEEDKDTQQPPKTDDPAAPTSPEETPEAPKAGETPAPKVEPPPIKDALDEVQLPPYSKPKTGEAFDKVKALARETISKKDAELEALRKEIAERDEKLKSAPTPEQAKKLEEQAKELEELRNFRRAADIENDPTFKANYDGKIDANNNAILAKLAENGMSKEHIDAIKSMGVEAVDWEPIMEKLPPPLRHYISAKLGSNIELRDARREAVEAARKEPSQFETKRSEAQAKALTETANSFLSKMAWTAEKQFPANATPEQKAEIEAHNKIAKNAQTLVRDALASYSPEVFAELAVGTAAAHKYKSEFTALKASSDAAAEKAKTDLEAVTKERDAARAELEKIKKAGRTHVRSGATVTPAAVDTFTINGSDALDRLRAEAE